MIWNTIVHPKMMTSGDGDMAPADGPTLPDESESTIEGIKYADPHKLAFFDLLIDATDASNPKLIHGDFETVKNKILNHELVVGGEILYDISLNDEPSVSITISQIIRYAENQNQILLDIIVDGTLIPYVVSSDNTVSTGDNPESQNPNLH